MLSELLSRRLESISDNGTNGVTTTMTIGSQDDVRVDAVDARTEDRRTNRNLMLRDMLQNVHVGHVEKDSYESKTNNDEDDEPVAADESDELNNNNEDALNLKTCVDEDNADKMDVDRGNQCEFAESFADDKNKKNCLEKPTPNEEKYISSSPESDIFDDDLDDDALSSPPPASRLQLMNVEPTEQKRARVENIVSGMRSSPLPSVNGCKKRKLYQPQQQHPSANFRYRKCDVDDEEVDCRRPKENEKDALESQMRAMQERLNEMEREYTQLRDLKVKVDDYDDYEEAFSPKKKTRLHSPATTPLSRTPASSPFKESINGGGLTSPRNTAANKDKQYSRKDKNCWRVNDCNGAASRYSQHRKQHYFNDAHFDSSDVAHREFQASVKTAATHGKRAGGANNQSYHRAVKVSDFSRSSASKTPMASSVSSECFDLEGLADALKSEITLTLTNLIDIIVTRFVQQQRVADKDGGDEAARTAEQLNKDLMLASQLLDRKLPRSKAVIGRETPFNDKEQSAANKSAAEVAKLSSSLAKSSIAAQISAADAVAAMKNPAAAAALYSSASCFANSPSNNVFDYTESARVAPEQNEALSLVVPQKKKRHKVTDNRITPRTVNRILSHDMTASGPPRSPTSSLVNSPTKFESPAASPPRSYPFAHNAMLPVSLPTSVAIPNPILHESRVYSPYNIFYEQRRPASSSPPAYNDQSRDSSPPPPALGHHTIFHSALMAAGTPQQQQRSHNQRRKGSSSPDYTGTSIDCNSMEYDGMTPTLSTLSPLHLRKAKLMFFWVRYPNPTVLKMYFPDVKFNKQNSAQLVKWFSNFREFYYSSIEKCARTELANGRKDANDLHVSNESKIYEDLNMHYNRNQHIQVPSNFRYVVEQTLKEIFKVIQAGKDKETSWKKPIYKIIGALDDQVPEYFKLQSFLDQLA